MKPPECYRSNLDIRFISKGVKSIKVSVPLPRTQKKAYKNIGFIKIGEAAAIKKAVAWRDELGLKHWGKHWPYIIANWKTLVRFPRNSLEPIKMHTKHGTLSYAAYWSERDTNDNTVRKHRKYSTKKHGKLGAYLKAKRALLDAHQDRIELLLFMGKISPLDLK